LAYEQIGELMGIVVREALKPYDWLAPVFHLATIIFVILLWKFNLKIFRYFYAYLAVNFVFMALAQNITFNEKFGFVVISNNLLHIAGKVEILGGTIGNSGILGSDGRAWTAKLQSNAFVDVIIWACVLFYSPSVDFHFDLVLS